jgi:hypothetical protein
MLGDDMKSSIYKLYEKKKQITPEYLNRTISGSQNTSA